MAQWEGAEDDVCGWVGGAFACEGDWEGRGECGCDEPEAVSGDLESAEDVSWSCSLWVLDGR